MARYCVNRNGDHEVHKVAECNHLPYESNRIDFNAENDSVAMARARTHYSAADGCQYCMPRYHTK